MSTCEQIIDIRAYRPAGLAQDSNYIDKNLGLGGRLGLALELQNLGANISFSRGSDAYRADTETALLCLPFEPLRAGKYAIAVSMEEVSFNAIGAIRNTTKILGGDLPELNHGAVRKACLDKATTNDVLNTVNLDKKYALWSQNESFEEVLAGLKGEQLVVKPRSGKRSKDVVIASKSELCKLQTAGAFASGDWIIEERLMPVQCMPVRGLDESNQRQIDDAVEKGRPMELRVYNFGRNPDGELATSHVLRIGGETDTTHLQTDDWCFVDPDTVPDEVRSANVAVAEAFQTVTGVQEMHIGIDWVNLGGGQWVPMEVNGTEPQLIKPEENQAVAKHQAFLLAKQLLRVMEAGGTMERAAA